MIRQGCGCSVQGKAIKMSGWTLNEMLGGILGGIWGGVLGWTIAPATAQLIPDQTLPQPSQVTVQSAAPALTPQTDGLTDGLTDNSTGDFANLATDLGEYRETWTISNGTRAGENLFHSFESFTLPATVRAQFDLVDLGLDRDAVTGELNGNISPTDLSGANLGLERILLRLTGDQAMVINGRLDAPIDLIILSPHGIQIGETAHLNLGGSLIATTGEALTFADGFTWSATNPISSPLLAVTAPIGVQFGTGSGTANPIAPITFQGHPQTASLQSRAPDQLSDQLNDQLADLPANQQNTLNRVLSLDIFGLGRGLGTPGIVIPSAQPLTLAPQATLAFLGGLIALQRADIDVGSGSLVLGSVNRGTVGLSHTPGATFGDWQVRFDAAELGGELRISDRSALRSAADPAGSIALATGDLRLDQGAFILSQNLGDRAAGSLTLQSRGQIQIDGFPVAALPIVPSADLAIDTATNPAINPAIDTATNPTNAPSNGSSPLPLSSFIGSDALAGGAGGAIDLQARQLDLINGGAIHTVTYGQGSAGNVNAQVDQDLQLSGESGLGLTRLSNLGSITLGFGNAGDVTVQSQNLYLTAGGTVSSLSLAVGNTGELRVNVADRLEAIGTTRDRFQSSSLATGTFASGNAGNVTIEARHIAISDGARLGSNTFNNGNVGAVHIHAIDSIDIIGTDPSRGISQIAATTLPLTEALNLPASLQAVLDLFPALPQGNAGNLTIRTPYLSLIRGGEIRVANRGIGNPGALQIDAQTVNLSDRSSIVADTRNGQGGNIQITADQLNINQSIISATSVGAGNGGNIQLQIADRLTLRDLSFADTEAYSLQLIQNSLRLNTANASSANGTSGTSGASGTNGVSGASDASGANNSLVNPPRSGNRGIVSGALGSGNAGNIEIVARHLDLLDGGLISTAAFGAGNAGDITFQVGDRMTLNGSVISTSNFSSQAGTGVGGNIELTADRLDLLGGSLIATASFGRATAGNLNLVIRDQLNIIGPRRAMLTGTGLFSGTEALNSGNGQNLTIQARSINLHNGAEISASSQGRGDAGNVTLQVDHLSVTDRSSIAAASVLGEGGNVVVRAQTGLILDRGGIISAEAGRNAPGGGNGGNINLSGDVIVSLRSGQINANAFLGNGGNIQIATQGLFTDRTSVIDASSQLGIDGQVSIRSPLDRQTVRFAPLADTPLLGQTVTLGCVSDSRDRFAVVGRGQLPLNPSTNLAFFEPWVDDRPWRSGDTATLNSAHPTNLTHPFTPNPTQPTANPNRSPIAPTFDRPTLPQPLPQTLREATSLIKTSPETVLLTTEARPADLSSAVLHPLIVSCAALSWQPDRHD